MTFKIKASVAQAAGIKDFPVVVTTAVAELTQHAKHMVEVGQGRAQAYPAPALHPLVSEAIHRDGGKVIPDFEVEDDSAEIAARALAIKKQALMNRVSQIESDAIQAVLPRGKQRLHNLRVEEIMNTRNALASRDWVKGEVAQGRAEQSVLDSTQNALTAVLAARGLDEKDLRSWKPQDDEYLAQADPLALRVKKIERHAAELHAEIEDLTPAAIEKWSPAPFPK